MAIGKSKVTQMNISRVVEMPTSTGEKLAVCRFNGAQRDAFMSVMFELRDRFSGKDPAQDIAKVDEKNLAKTLTTEQLQGMMDMQYRIILLSVVDGDRLGDGVVVPLFDNIAQVADMLEPAVAKEWSDICNAVNGLGEDAVKKETEGFFATPKDEPGSASPVNAEGSTSPS